MSSTSLAADRGTPRERVALATATALLLAGLVLVVAVLPAEYGVDPFGIGRRLGLTAMSDLDQQLTAYEQSKGTAAAGSTTVVAQDAPYRQETIDFRLGPGEFVEYKYRLDKGEALLYSWKATAPVNVEFHAEPDGAPRGYAETYEKKDAVPSATGTLTAPFPGIHGWYWMNPTGEAVTVSLSTAGFYNMAHEFRKDEAPKAKMFQ
ncbi:MAG: hypothetical protein AB7I13_04490 [Vicinamibacterales bacterium]